MICVSLFSVFYLRKKNLFRISLGRNKAADVILWHFTDAKRPMNMKNKKSILKLVQMNFSLEVCSHDRMTVEHFQMRIKMNGRNRKKKWKLFSFSNENHKKIWSNIFAVRQFFFSIFLFEVKHISSRFTHNTQLDPFRFHEMKFRMILHSLASWNQIL